MTAKLISKIIGLTAFGLTGCVGPTTPFGALDEVVPNPQMLEESSLKKTTLKVRFVPDRQVYHDQSDLAIVLESPKKIPINTQILIYHNGINVTQSFLKNSRKKRSTDGHSMKFVFEGVRLKTLDPNLIKVRVKEGRNWAEEAIYPRPECSLFQQRNLASIGKFNGASSYIELIEQIASKQNVNPSFLAGVVAQESGFDSKAVSWARAMGLTQMTGVAEEQVIGEFTNWPRYPEVNSLSYVELRSKIILGEIDEENEWRLNPELSLMGGIAYIRYLQKYWRSPENETLIGQLHGDREQLMSELILASYNSGASRVKKALITYRGDWKKSESLREAVKYLIKVKSYCYHYGEKRSADDSET